MNAVRQPLHPPTRIILPWQALDGMYTLIRSMNMMSSRKTRFCPRLFLVFLFGSLAGAYGASPVNVLVAVPPYVEIARALGGDAVTVQTLLEAGESHESFAPTPGRVLGWRHAELYWSIGLDFESQWLPKLQTLASGMEVVDSPLDLHAGPAGHDHAHGHAHGDAHAWLDPSLMRVQARAFVEHLITLRPERRAEFEANLEAFERHSRALEEKIASRLAPYKGSRFYVYHGAFDYFAAAFGLEQVALQRGARPPSVRELAELIEQARADGATVVFVQPQESVAAARKLARAIGAEVISLDPLAADWDANLLAIAAALEIDFARRPPGP